MRKIVVLLFVACLSFASVCHANNLTISNVGFDSRDPANDKVVIKFDVSWENSWKSKINHDAAWLTFRLYSSVSPTVKTLCNLSTSGLNPDGTTTGLMTNGSLTTTNSNIELYVPADKKGVFIRPTAYGSHATLSSTKVEVTLDYASCGFADNDNVYAGVNGLEMVFVPEGAFYAGDQAVSTASLMQGSSDSDPWYIADQGPLSVSNPASNGYRYVSNGNTNEEATGASFTVPATFPNGYNGFYAMKYEITEGQWVEFINSLSAEARSNHDLTDGTHKNSDSVTKRNTISCSGATLSCTTSRPNRPVSFLTWMDLAAFLDWAALRPMTELEFEKMARGPVYPVKGEYVWGTTNIAAAVSLSGVSEDGTETVTNAANAHYSNVTLSGGDSANGADYTQGPLRAGIFSEPDSIRETAGSSYYGALDMAGNLRERVVTIGNSTARLFTGSEGDGILSTESGYEGNANESDWPGMDAVAARGITGAFGSGLKGGGWDDAADRLRISDRNDAANGLTGSASNAGGRGVKTYDGE
jgi:formylglycine-generating enzyme required for sulfatase activity